jgi:putative flippase GtrA
MSIEIGTMPFDNVETDGSEISYPSGVGTDGFRRNPRLRLPSTRGARFLIVGFGCLLIDLSVAAALVAFGATVTVAGGMSHVAASSTSYAVHERWTFASRGGFTLKRFAAVMAAYGVALGIRIACLAASSHPRVLGHAYAVPQIMFAGAVAFLFSYHAVGRILGGRIRS